MHDNSINDFRASNVITKIHIEAYFKLVPHFAYFGCSNQGATNWNQYSIVLDVLKESKTISFGLLLEGKGKVWVDNLMFEIVDLSVPTTGEQCEEDIPMEPLNLQFKF